MEKFCLSEICHVLPVSTPLYGLYHELHPRSRRASAFDRGRAVKNKSASGAWTQWLTLQPSNRDAFDKDPLGKVENDDDGQNGDRAGGHQIGPDQLFLELAAEHLEPK